MLVLAEVERTGIIAILRGDLKGRAINIVEALLRSGITAIEVTMNSPGALEMIHMLRREIPVPFALGAGTVLHVDEVEAACDVGAQFIVSPNIAAPVIQATKRLGMASFPGGATCSEIIQGLNEGADAIKIFPASALPPKEMRTIRGPLGNIRLIPTGGLTPDAIAGYCAVGAWAFGIGSALVDANKEKPIATLERDATRFIEAVAHARGSR